MQLENIQFRMFFRMYFISFYFIDFKLSPEIGDRKLSLFHCHFFIWISWYDNFLSPWKLAIISKDLKWTIIFYRLHIHTIIAILAITLIYRQFGDRIGIYCPVGTKLNIMPVCICLSLPLKTKSSNWAKQRSIEWFVLKSDMSISFFLLSLQFESKLIFQ